MKVIVSVILLAILAWLVFSTPDKGKVAGTNGAMVSTQAETPAQEAERDSEALAQALDSIHQVQEDVVPDDTVIPEPEAEAVVKAETNEKGENSVTVEVEEFAALKGVDLEKPAAKKPAPISSTSVDDIAAVIEKAATASTVNASGDNYLSALEDEATATDLAIRKINNAVANIKSAKAEGGDSYLQGLEGEAEETSVKDVYVAGGVTPTEDFREKIEGAGNVYRVKAGDSLSLIAAQYYGDALMYHKIFAANRSTMKNPDFLAIGQKLVIPPAN